MKRNSIVNVRIYRFYRAVKTVVVFKQKCYLALIHVDLKNNYVFYMSEWKTLKSYEKEIAIFLVHLQYVFLTINPFVYWAHKTYETRDLVPRIMEKRPMSISYWISFNTFLPYFCLRIQNQSLAVDKERLAIVQRWWKLKL